jgi:hypothetical protein
MKEHGECSFHFLVISTLLDYKIMLMLCTYFEIRPLHEENGYFLSDDLHGIDVFSVDYLAVNATVSKLWWYVVGVSSLQHKYILCCIQGCDPAGTCTVNVLLSVVLILILQKEFFADSNPHWFGCVPKFKSEAGI